MIKKSRKQNYKWVQIIDLTKTFVPMNTIKAVRELLQHIPNRHLVGLKSITIKDEFKDRKLGSKRGLYFKKTQSTAATIELSLHGIFGSDLLIVYVIPVLGKILMAQVLLKELALHRLEQIEEISAQEQKEFPQKYTIEIMKKAFHNFLRFYKWCGPFRRWVLKHAD